MWISLLVQQGREGLVDQEAKNHVQHSLEEGEGHIEDGQALDEAVGGGENRTVADSEGSQRTGKCMYSAFADIQQRTVPEGSSDSVKANSVSQNPLAPK